MTAGLKPPCPDHCHAGREGEEGPHDTHDTTPRPLGDKAPPTPYLPQSDQSGSLCCSRGEGGEIQGSPPSSVRPQGATHPLEHSKGPYLCTSSAFPRLAPPQPLRNLVRAA